MSKDLYIVSRCLLGVNCKYNGGNNYSQDVVEFTRVHKCFDVCPETAGGLDSPRSPAEQVYISEPVANCEAGHDIFINELLINEKGEPYKVVNQNGEDLTTEFVRGAKKSLEDAKAYADSEDLTITGAILKDRSPSCGYGRIYDGTFSGTEISGNGVFADLLRNEDIPIANEENFAELFGD